MSRFTECLALILAEEGGYSNHPKDPGGATMRGVIQRVYDTYRQSKGLATQNVRQISEDELQAIYRERYWNLVHGDRLPPGIDLVVFDGAVNSGPAQSVKWLQRSVNDLRSSSSQIGVDGLIGPETLNAIVSCPDHRALVNHICNRRLAMLKRLSTWPTFKGGWSARVSHMRANGLTMTEASSVQFNGRPATDGAASAIMTVQSIEGANAKASTADIKKAPPVAPADAALGAGAVTAALSQAQDQLAPFASIDAINRVSAALAALGVAVMLGALVYRLWAKRRAAANKDALETA
ncbi:N-acetylmuramidase [Martelella alba]|uniref:N-acetylmuramidase n=1 Tax=Martelella alba TaxID=2590451 RepID=A0A506UGV7_9HYPH|nr:glycosyl hydrolase 108 family protein [Martelella alba]TPW31457.1 N-acetylmuramidase [Martelella alba]